MGEITQGRFQLQIIWKGSMVLRVQQQSRPSCLFFHVISRDKIIALCDVGLFGCPKDFDVKNLTSWVFRSCGSSSSKLYLHIFASQDESGELEPLLFQRLLDSGYLANSFRRNGSQGGLTCLPHAASCLFQSCLLLWLTCPPVWQLVGSWPTGVSSLNEVCKALVGSRTGSLGVLPLPGLLYLFAFW